MNDYEHLLWTCLIPPLRNAIMGLWSPREPEPLLKVLAVWQPVLPSWMLRNIIDQLVMPRLRAEVEAWDPRTDPVPLHQWLQPLATVAPAALQELYPTVRFKLAACLQAWQPDDPSALAMLLPWRTVWSDRDMRLLLARCIEPKLGSVLRNMDPSPAAADLRPIGWVLAWMDMLDTATMAQLLAEHFFPNFSGVLARWLLQDAPNFQEITQWYLGWKSQLPTAIVADPNVQQQLRAALTLLNLNVTQPEQGRQAAEQRLADLAVRAQRQSRRGPARGVSPTTQSLAETKPVPRGGGLKTATPQVTLRDLLSQLAERHDVTFAPRLGRMSTSGQPLYAFGSASLYIEQDVVFAKSKAGATYLPVSLDALPSLARA